MEAKPFCSPSHFSFSSKLIAFRGSANARVLRYRPTSRLGATDFHGRQRQTRTQFGIKLMGSYSRSSLFSGKHHSPCWSMRDVDNPSKQIANANKYNNNFKAHFEALIKGIEGGNRNKMAVLVLYFFRRIAAIAVVLSALGFVPHRALQFRALAAAPAAANVTLSTGDIIQHRNEDKGKENEISVYKQELEEAVTLLEQRLQELQAREKTNEELQIQIRRIKEALDIIRAKSKALRSKTLFHTEATLRRLRKEEEKFIKEAQKIVDAYAAARRELERMSSQQEARADERRQKAKEKKENEVRDAENKFRDIWSALTRLEAEIVAKETEGLRLAFQEIPAVEKDSENKVKDFFRPTSISEYQGYAKESIVERIKKDLEGADYKTWEQLFLPIAVDAEEPQVPVNEEKRKLVEHINIQLQNSRKMQEQLDSLVRSQFKRVGKEKLLLVETPEEDVAQGLPPVKLQWLFGDNEVYVPRAASHHMAQGWKKWREEAKANLKKKFLEDVQLGKAYVAERQSRLLSYQERVIARTRYNENEMRWEMDPVAASFAVSKEFVRWAGIRQDWAVMYIGLKGDDRIYHVDIQAYDSLFEQVGGFDGLFVKMVTSGVPITVKLNRRRSFKHFIQFFYIIVTVPVWDWYLEKLKEVLDEFMVRFGFPIIELITQRLVGELIVGSTYYLNWAVTAEQSAQEMNEYRRVQLRLPSWFIFTVKCCLYGYPILVVLRYLFKFLRKFKYIDPFLVTLPETPRQARLSKVQKWSKQQPPSPEKKKGRRKKGKKKEGNEEAMIGIQNAFDRMKRIKNPPILLRDFFGIEAVKQEVNEIVTFLKNPKRFKEMGARAPRGVLITGRAATGKTSLAFAIAAEAKVPLVEVTPEDLEDVRWIGQGPANVRELFQTAREVAPVIIFMDNFDTFAGTRGDKTNTKMLDKKQEHEALINQLLVELDGFETQEGVVFIATARRPEDIDQALRRPGRMDRTIRLSFLPDEREREMMLLSAAKSTMRDDLVDFVDWQQVVEKTAGLTAKQVMAVPRSLEMAAFSTKISDDEELFSMYGWLMTIDDITPHWLKHSKWMKKLEAALIDRLGLRLTKEDMELTVENMEPYGRVNPGLEIHSPPIVWSRESKFPHAVWAAGRGLVALVLPNFDSVDNIWLDPTSWEGVGWTKLTKYRGGMEDTQTINRSYLEKQLVLCFGSSAANQLLKVEANNLSRYDIEEAHEIATRMVLEYGWGPDDSAMVYWTSNLRMKTLHMGKDHELELEAKAEKLFYTAYDKAIELLQKNLGALDAVVEHLLEYDVLTKQDMLRILKENGAVQEPEPFMLVNNRTYELNADMSTNGTARISGRAQSATSGV